jgi:hypothetical protein
MLCYRDRTFCRFWKDCKRGDVCIRKLTDEVIDKATAISLPICEYNEKPDCFIEKKLDKQYPRH